MATVRNFEVIAMNYEVQYVCIQLENSKESWSLFITL